IVSRGVGGASPGTDPLGALLAKESGRRLEPVPSGVESVPHGAPRLPGDPKDHEGDREPDERIGDLCAECDEGCARDDPEGDESVRAGVVTVCDKRGAVQTTSGAEPDEGCDLVPREA